MSGALREDTGFGVFRRVSIPDKKNKPDASCLTLLENGGRTVRPSEISHGTRFFDSSA